MSQPNTHPPSGSAAQPRIAAFSTKKWVSDAFQAANATQQFDIGYIEARLYAQTAKLADDYDVVCVFVNDQVDAEVLEKLKAFGVRLVALRCAGFNNVDIKHAQALGIAAGAYELSLKYSKERKAFGTEIKNHQAIAFKLADMHTRIEAARNLVYRAAWDKDQGHNYDLSSAMAKLYASEVAMWASVEAVQIHGGNGFVKDYHVERMMRDAKITQIYEGTSEIQKIVISRSILKQ